MSSETAKRGRAWTRRQLLQRMAATAGAVAAIAVQSISAPAAIKISKTAVAYQDHPQGDKRCGKCLQFQAPDGCKMVDGSISPQGFCRIFTPQPQAARSAAAPLTG